MVHGRVVQTVSAGIATAQIQATMDCIAPIAGRQTATVPTEIVSDLTELMHVATSVVNAIVAPKTTAPAKDR